MNNRTVCNLCGSSTWLDMGARIAVRCAGCGSLERTRAVKLILESIGRPAPGDTVLHFAPEKALSGWFREVANEGYDPVDINPDFYPDAKARPFDLMKDTAALPSDHYDLIVHIHVLEHIPMNIAPILHHLHRSLKPSGLHAFCVPIIDAPYDEYYGRLPKDVAARRFGQFDHVRLFGQKDMDQHLGSILNLNYDYSLGDYASSETMDRCNIPEYDRSGLNGSTIFLCRKSDYRLWL